MEFAGELMRRATWYFLYFLGLVIGSALWLAVGLAFGEQPTAILTAPTIVPSGMPIVLDGSQSKFDDAYACRWKVVTGGPVAGTAYDKGGKKGLIYIVAPPKPGTYTFVLVVSGKLADGTLDNDFAFAQVVVGDVPPVPPGPGPGPGPTPPVPPGPVPIPGDGLRVLVVYETTDLGKMPPGQLAVLYGGVVHQYLNSKCPVGKDGKTKEWRIYDQHIDVSAEDTVWQNAMKRERKSVPWVVISNGKTGFEGPLPATVDDTMKLLQQYGG